MGLLGRILSYARATVDEAEDVGEATVDIGGGDNRTAQHFTNPGVDSRPLAEDTAAMLERRRELAIVGTLDPAGGVAGAGEIRIYARDGDGPIVFVHLKSDGALTIENRDGGAFEMAADGNVTINGVLIDTDGNVSAPGEVTAMDGPGTAVGLSTHMHNTAMGPTDPPTAGT